MKKIPSPLLRNLEAQNQARSSFKGIPPILALDYGEKFCGLAFSPDGVCALPLEVVKTPEIEKRIRDIVNKKSVQSMVIGLPLLPDGKENKLCGVIRQFAKKIEDLAPVTFINERFSSKSVIPQKTERIDDFAAVKILEFSFAKK